MSMLQRSHQPCPTALLAVIKQAHGTMGVGSALACMSSSPCWAVSLPA